MQTFTAVVKKPDTNGRLTIIELPFNAVEVFDCKKGTIRVCGTIHGTEYRNKLIPKGKGYLIKLKCTGINGKRVKICKNTGRVLFLCF
jgi:hypothetical protein